MTIRDFYDFINKNEIKEDTEIYVEIMRDGDTISTDWSPNLVYSVDILNEKYVAFVGGVDE